MRLPKVDGFSLWDSRRVFSFRRESWTWYKGRKRREREETWGGKEPLIVRDIRSPFS